MGERKTYFSNPPIFGVVRATSTRLMSDIYFIEGENKGRFPYCNSVLAKNVLIDAGLGKEIVEGILPKVKTLILSHNHVDHCLFAWAFNEAKKEVLSPEGFETDLDSLAKRFIEEDYRNIWKQYVKSVGFRSFVSDRYREGLITEEPEIIAINLKGHTEDMHIFIIEGRILYSADIDLTGFGPWYGNPESDPKEFKRSVERIADLDFEILVPSHKKPVLREKALEELNRFLDIFDEREKAILDIIDGRTLEELVELSPIYRRKPYWKDVLDYFERNMIIKHIEILKTKGLVREDNGRFFKV